MLTLSVVANFLHGADTFNPLAAIFDWIRKVSVWWLLPLLFAARVPVLVLRMTELATRLALQATGIVANDYQQPVVPSGRLPELVVGVVRICQEESATPLSEVADQLAVSPTEASRLRLQAMNLQLPERETRGYYVPLVPVERIQLRSGSSDWNGER